MTMKLKEKEKENGEGINIHHQNTKLTPFYTVRKLDQ
jgi:hypothetical protein